MVCSFSSVNFWIAQLKYELLLEYNTAHQITIWENFFLITCNFISTCQSLFKFSFIFLIFFFRKALIWQSNHNLRSLFQTTYIFIPHVNLGSLNNFPFIFLIWFFQKKKTLIWTLSKFTTKFSQLDYPTVQILAEKCHIMHWQLWIKLVNLFSYILHILHITNYSTNFSSYCNF